MDNLDEVYNILYNSTFAVNPVTKKTYLLFFKKLIEKFLEDTTKNYIIYVSTNDKCMAMYQSVWPAHERLRYVSESFIPSFIPNNINAIYFYHQNTKVDKDNQFALIDFLEEHPSIKYVYVGSIKKLLTITYIKLFNYYLHFEVRGSRWGGIHSDGILDHRVCRSTGRRYYTQKEKKKNATGMCTLYDYFIFHDLHIEVSKMYRFNKKIVKGKKKKPPTDNTNRTAGVVKEVQIKYIYTNSHSSRNYLVMPDGKRENFNEIIKQYQNVIEV